MRKIPYWQQLRDPRWQEVRLKVFERADFQCEVCGSKPEGESLEVHHHYYETGAMAWEYPMESLLCVCRECHRTVADNERLFFEAINPHDYTNLDVLAEAIFHANQVGLSLWQCSRAIKHATLRIEKKSKKKPALSAV
jgi:hypothetical protein